MVASPWKISELERSEMLPFILKCLSSLTVATWWRRGSGRRRHIAVNDFLWSFSLDRQLRFEVPTIIVFVAVVDCCAADECKRKYAIYISIKKYVFENYVAYMQARSKELKRKILVEINFTAQLDQVKKREQAEKRKHFQRINDK